MGGRLLKGWPALLLTLLVTLALAAPAPASFPGQNGKLAFDRHPFSGDSRSWTMNPDGSDPAPLGGECPVPAGSGPDEPPSMPQWSPDGSKVLYVCWYDTLRIINADGTGDQLVQDNFATTFALAWSPDAQRIVFSIAYLETFGTWVMPGPGYSGSSTFLSDRSQPLLDWSPDGTSIALEDGGHGDLWTISPDGTGLTNLTNTPGEFERQASWAPNNSKLAFRKRDAAGWSQIDTIQPDGGGLAQVTTGATHKGDPVWSPDGTRIAFTGTLDGQAVPDVYTMDADGTNVVRLTSTPEIEENLDWQPIPINAYPRPVGAYPMRVSLVPAYQPCSSPNRTHGPPLGFGSCNPPAQEPGQLTLGTPDANGQGAKSLGHLRVITLTGNPATPEDEADVRVLGNVTDVRMRSDLSDYTGALEARFTVQITDKNNTPHPGGPGAATVQELTLSHQIPCAGTADTSVGSTCQLDTTIEALLPGAVVEKRRAIWELGAIRVHDGAGNLFLTQGLFVP